MSAEADNEWTWARLVCYCNEARDGFVLTLYFLHLLPFPLLFFSSCHLPSLPCPLSSPILLSMPLLSLISSMVKLLFLPLSSTNFFSFCPCSLPLTPPPVLLFLYLSTHTDSHRLSSLYSLPLHCCPCVLVNPCSPLLIPLLSLSPYLLFSFSPST